MKSRTSLSLLGIVAIAAVVFALFPRTDAAVRWETVRMTPVAPAGTAVDVYLRPDVMGYSSASRITPFRGSHQKLTGEVKAWGEQCLVITDGKEDTWIPWNMIVGVKAKAEQPATVLEAPAR